MCLWKRLPPWILMWMYPKTLLHKMEGSWDRFQFMMFNFNSSWVLRDLRINANGRSPNIPQFQNDCFDGYLIKLRRASNDHAKTTKICWRHSGVVLLEFLMAVTMRLSSVDLLQHRSGNIVKSSKCWEASAPSPYILKGTHVDASLIGNHTHLNTICFGVYKGLC